MHCRLRTTELLLASSSSSMQQGECSYIQLIRNNMIVGDDFMNRERILYNMGAVGSPLCGRQGRIRFLDFATTMERGNPMVKIDSPGSGFFWLMLGDFGLASFNRWEYQTLSVLDRQSTFCLAILWDSRNQLEFPQIDWQSLNYNIFCITSRSLSQHAQSTI